MKIVDGTPISGQPLVGPKAPKKDNPAGASFSEVLKKTVDALSAKQKQAQAVSAAPSTQVEPAAPQPAAASAGRRTIERIERFLDVMDDYRSRLGDSQCSLKQIQPVVEQMAAQRQQMQLLLEGLSDQEPLKEVLNRALVTASTEEWKFNRGDYT